MSLICKSSPSQSSFLLNSFLACPNSRVYYRSINICKCRAPRPRHYFRPPSACLFQREVITVQEGGNGNLKEGLKLKWHDVGPDLTEAQKHEISQLSPKMTNRCKAIMRRIICFSQEDNLVLLLASWVKAMQPKRCDWLSVLKEIKRVNVSLFFEAMEYALNEEPFEANVRDYTKLMHAYLTHDRLNNAQNTFQSMQTKNFPCDQITLTILINMHSKANNLLAAQQTFEQIKLLNSPIDKRAYGSMIMAYIRARRLDLAETLLAEMEEKQVFAGREVYKAMLRAFSMAGDEKGAQRIFDAIQFAGIVPDGRICALLVNAYCAAGKMGDARSVMKNMRDKGVMLNDKCVAVMLRGYRRENELEMGLEFLMEVERDGVEIGGEASEVLAQWLKGLGVINEVELALK